jgi:hypothetical protein
MNRAEDTADMFSPPYYFGVEKSIDFSGVCVIILIISKKISLDAP